MFNKKIIIVFGVIMMFGILTAGCGKKETTTYKYENKEHSDEFYLTKAIYGNDKIKIYYEAKGKLETVDTSVEFYDGDLKRIDEKYDVIFKDGVLTISGKDAKKISGIKISINSSPAYAIRYLDSKKYAMLEYLFASDEGYIEFGDKEAYYSEKEKEAEKEEKARQKENEERAYSFLEGVWTSKDETNKIKIYKNENDTIIVRYYWYDEDVEEIKESDVYCESASMSEDEESGEKFFCLSTGNMTASLDFEMNNAGTELTDKREGIVYKK